MSLRKAIEEVYKYDYGTPEATRHAKKMTPGQNVKEDDDGEYDYEGEMAKNQLRTMIDAAQELHDSLEDNENMPEWVQGKITKATDYIDSVRDYMKSKKEMGEAAPTKKPFDSVGYAKQGMKYDKQKGKMVPDKKDD